MKKDKQESPLKAARKKNREAIEARLARHIRNITNEIGHEAVDIEKEAKKLAKKITKGLKNIEKEKAEKEAVKVAEKPASKPPVLKTPSVKETVVKKPEVAKTPPTAAGKAKK